MAEGIEAIIQWQKRVSPKYDDHCLLRFCENGETWLSRSDFQILHRGTIAPLRDDLGVSAQHLAQLRKRSLPLMVIAAQCPSGNEALYCGSDALRALSADLLCKLPAG